MLTLRHRFVRNQTFFPWYVYVMRELFFFLAELLFLPDFHCRILFLPGIWSVKGQFTAVLLRLSFTKSSGSILILLFALLPSLLFARWLLSSGLLIF